jgi:hypothetical protein
MANSKGSADHHKQPRVLRSAVVFQLVPRVVIESRIQNELADDDQRQRCIADDVVEPFVRGEAAEPFSRDAGTPFGRDAERPIGRHAGDGKPSHCNADAFPARLGPIGVVSQPNGCLEMMGHPGPKSAVTAAGRDSQRIAPSAPRDPDEAIQAVLLPTDGTVVPTTAGESVTRLDLCLVVTAPWHEYGVKTRICLPPVDSARGAR